MALGKTAKDRMLGPRCRSIVRGGKGVVTRLLGTLGAIFAWGQENGYVHHNPVRGVKRFADQQKKALLIPYCAKRCAQPEPPGIGRELHPN